MTNARQYKATPGPAEDNLTGDARIAPTIDESELTDRRVEACDRVKRGNPQGLDRKPITKPQTKPELGI